MHHGPGPNEWYGARVVAVDESIDGAARWVDWDGADEARFFLSDSNSSSLGSLIAPFAFLGGTSSICSASASVRQILRVEEERISGSS
jgi:hypothetical protein